MGGVCTSACWDTHSPTGRHCQADTPWVDTPLGQTPPPQQTATAADGTHPTGMHSCLRKSQYK